MRLLLNNTAVPLPEGFSVRLMRYNPLYSDEGTYSLDVRLPAAEDPVRSLTANSQHPQAPTATVRTTFRLECPEAGIEAVEGTAILTTITGGEAAFMLRSERVKAGRAALASDTETLPGAADYIDTATYPAGTLFTIDLSDLTAAQARRQVSEYRTLWPSCYVCATEGEDPASDPDFISEGGAQWVFLPVTGDDVSVGDADRLPLHPRLPWLVETVVKAVSGLTLRPEDNCLRFHPAHAALVVLNPRPTDRLGDILPHWTLSEFLLELRRLLGVVPTYDGQRLYLNYVHQPYRYAPDALRRDYDSDGATEPISLTPLLPRSYEVEEADYDEDSGAEHTSNNDPRRANTAYDLLTEATLVEQVPDTLWAAYPHQWGTAHGALWYHACHKATNDNYIELGSAYSGSEGNVGNFTFIHSAPESAPGSPLERAQDYYDYLDPDTGRSRHVAFPVSGQPPVTLYGAQQVDNAAGSGGHSEPGYECDYIGPCLRHDAAAGKTDYQHRISPARFTRWGIRAEDVGTTAMERLLALYGTTPLVVNCPITDQSDYREYYEERDTMSARTGRTSIMGIIENAEEFDPAEKPEPPEGLEIFVY